jgi:hypothetical protein
VVLRPISRKWDLWARWAFVEHWKALDAKRDNAYTGNPSILLRLTIMPLLKPEQLSDIQSQFRRLWLGGFKKEIRIPCDSKREAINFRLRMYKFAKPYREDLSEPLVDKHLTYATQQTELMVERVGEEFFLLIHPSNMNEVMNRAMRALEGGSTEDDLMESQKRLAESMGMEWKEESPSTYVDIYKED